ncbi:MAG: NFACT family protein [Thermoplasmata archaeon]|nr:NFACT family protein [Thermoplasmata archaeon]
MGSAGPPARKDRFTALDTLALAREVRRMGWARVEKASDLAIGGITLTLRSRDEGRRDLALVPGRFAALLAEPPPRREELSPMAKELRRLLTGAILSDVPDPAGERYLELVFRRADVEEPLLLALELFGAGNLTVARGTRLVAVLHPRSWAHRTVRIGSEYSRPPSRGDPFGLTTVQVTALLEASRNDRASTLGAKLALGGPVAEELLLRAGVPGSLPAGQDAAYVAAQIHSAMAELRALVGDRPHGYLYAQAGVIVDAEPYPSQRWRAEPGVAEQERPTFSEAAWDYFSTMPPPLAKEVAAAPDPAAEIDRQLAQQREAIAHLQSEAAALVAEAAAILAHFPEAELALAKRENDGSEERTVEVPLAGRNVHLLLGRPVRASAQALFEEAKRAQSRLAGARRALAETELRRAEVPPETAPVATGASRDAEARPRFWFQKYRWFLSSEGVLVVGGRDAATNDLLVRRYLRPRDRYIHADIHGAPSVIVKHPQPPAPDATEVSLAEAGQFGVAFSKAWRAGLASASAFWVEADQVSKAAASGEFVARGAWVIHGTKHVMKDLPTEIGVGTVRYEGADLWCAGPPSALRNRGELRVVLVPGEERSRSESEVELSRDLGLSRDRLQSMLPAGGLAIRRA